MSDGKRAAGEAEAVTLPPGAARAPSIASLPPPAETEEDARATASLRLGQVIAEKYRIDEVVGRGGMGVVLRARHLALDEPVVIKVLRPSLMKAEGMMARFIREARAASKIKSEHVVRVTDVDALESGVPYMVMESLEGTDLAAVLREQGKLPVETAVQYILDVCDAIAEAHELGIIHRDLKPANLFVTRRRDGTPLIKVLDFGISKFEGADEEDSTKPGTMMGSPKFMAPEQMLSMHDADGRADIWALGAILYNMVTGVPPFVAANLPQVCALVLNADPVPPSQHRPEIPGALEAVVLRCLQKKPEDRFATVAELIEALAPFAPEAAVTASRQANELIRDGLPEEVPDRSTPASTQHTSITASLDAPAAASKRRPARRRLGWFALALMLVLGAGGVLFAPQIKPVVAQALQLTARFAQGATAQSPAATPPVDAPPAGTSSATVDAAAPASSVIDVAAVATTPTASATTDPRAPGGKKPWVPSGKSKKPSAGGDPFGGSRN